MGPINIELNTNIIKTCYKRQNKKRDEKNDFFFFFFFFNAENFQVFGYQMLKKNEWLGLFCHLEL